MANLRFDQVNIVVTDVVGATEFLRALGIDIPEAPAEWAAWAAHHVGIPAVTHGFSADLDSPAYATYWGGLPRDFTGVVVNLRADDSAGVDVAFAHALAIGAQELRTPYDAQWGARYAAVRGPGPIVVGIMGPRDPDALGEMQVSDFA